MVISNSNWIRSDDTSEQAIRRKFDNIAITDKSVNKLTSAFTRDVNTICNSSQLRAEQKCAALKTLSFKLYEFADYCQSVTVQDEIRGLISNIVDDRFMALYTETFDPKPISERLLRASSDEYSKIEPDKDSFIDMMLRKLSNESLSQKSVGFMVGALQKESEKELSLENLTKLFAW